MLHRWKFILTNWINCYSNEGIKKEQCVNLESLLTIISHLHENLNFDESKSSKLEAHTVEEFVREKYPQFKFENGTVEASNEEELYIVASLLLFFVCVNSKDVDIKNAMCSKLSSEDQETIMKFSKSLMECSPITFSDVQAAITEACGQDVAAVEAVPGLKMVAETPPALRSLHGEVRRLQAALDAERFDKNFLQEELARTNLKLEKLLKDKEQCKLDIVNLKSKISLCWGQETEVQGGDATSESTARLTRQLEDLEERLVLTQEQLDDAMSERDTYKAKVEQLKQERDKWLSVSQSEASRAAQLSEELETERHHVQSLQDLVSELRQHNLKNCLDASQLECDDPDASIHSLHNASVCSEACANVIEVQLSEERAKIVFLKQQVQGLQDQLTDLNQRAENETQSLRSIISDKDNDIFNLRHRINEEIEEKTNLNAHFSEEICRLNNEITELTQNLQHNSDSFRQVIEQKMQEIQTLQEEKLSLLQSLSDETTKLESIIKDLRTDIVTEKNIKQKMKEDYENHMMKLNEKVLNRNNELVELQNNVFEKSELIEQLYQDLRKEKEAKEELSNKCNDNIIQLNERNNAVERNLQQKCEEAKELQKRLQQNGVVFSELNKEIDDLKDINSELTMKCRILEDTKVSLLNDLQHHAYKIEDVQKEMKNIHQLFSEEKEELEQKFNERNATIDSLKVQLHDEIQYKTGLQNELATLQHAQVNLNEEVNKLNKEITTLKSDVQDKDRLIYALDLYLKEEKHLNKNLKQDYDTMSEEFKQELENKCTLLKEYQTQAEKDIEEYKTEISSLKITIDCVKSQLTEQIDTLKRTITSYESDLKEKDVVIFEITKEKDKLNDILVEQKHNADLCQTSLESNVASLNKELDKLKQENNELLNTIAENETVRLNQELSTAAEKLNLANKCALLEEYQAKAENQLGEYKTEILSLKTNIDFTKSQSTAKIDALNTEIANYDRELKEKDVIMSNIMEESEKLSKALIEFKKVGDSNQKELESKSATVNELRQKLEECKKEISSLMITTDCVKSQFTEQIYTLKTKLSSYESDLKEKDVIITQIIEEKDKLNKILVEEKDNAELHQKDLESNVAYLNKELGKIKQENNELLNKMAENESVRVNQEQRTAAEKLELANKCSLLEEYQSKAEKQLEEYKTEISSLKTNIDFIKSQFTADIDAFKKQIANYDCELKNKLVVVTNITEEKEMLSKALIEVKEEGDKYKTELVSKTAVIEELRQKLEEYKTEISSLKNTTDYVELLLTERIDTLKTTLTSFESDLKEKDVIISEITEEKNKLNEILVEQSNSAEIRQKDLESNVASLKEELGKLNQENNELLIKMAENDTVRVNQELSTVAEKMNLTNKCSLLEEYQAKAEKQLEEYKTEISSLKTNIDFIKLQSTADIDALRTEIANNDRELKEKDVILSNITEEKEMLSKALVEVKEVGDKYQKELESNAAIIRELRQKLEEYQREISSLKNTTDCLESQLTEQINTQKTTLTSYESDLKEKDVIITQITEEKDKLNKILVEQTDSAELRQKDLESNFASLSEEFDKMKQENNELQNKMAENETLRVNQELSTVAEKMNLTNKCSLLEEYQAQAEKQLEEYKTEISSLKTNIDFIKSQSTADIDALRTEIANSDRELKKKDVIMSNITEEKEMLSKALIEVKEVGDNYQKELECKEAIIQELIQKLEEYQREISSLKKTTDCVESQLTEQINTLKTTLTSYESDLKEKDVIISQITEEKDKLNKILVEQTDSAELRQKDLESNVASLSEEFDKMKQENNELQNKMAENETLRVNQELSAVAEKMNLASKCSLLEEYQAKAEIQLEEYKTEISSLKTNIDFIKSQSTADIDALRTEFDRGLKEKDVILSNITEEKEMLSKALVEVKEVGDKYQNELESKAAIIHELRQKLEDYNTEISSLKITADCVKSQLTEQVDTLKTTLTSYESDLKEKDVIITEIIEGKDKLNEILVDQKDSAESRQRELESNIENLKEELDKLKQENNELRNKMADNKTVRVNKDLRTAAEKLNLANKCSVLEEYQAKAEKQLEEYKTEISSLKSNIDFIKSQFTAEIDALKTEIANYDQELKKKDIIVSNITEEKEMLSKALVEVKEVGAKYQKELESKAATVYELRQKLEEVKKEALVLEVMQKENDHMITTVGQLETFALGNQEKSSSYKYFGLSERQHRDRHQVSTPTSDLTQSSMDSLKTISDLEKIINDKNRTITTLQSDITYLKSLMADSENKLLDVNKELEGSQETCQQLSSQLKKIVQQKNEEIADLKKQITKMSVTENRASQIIKVSAKYQAIILKRIAEIKSNTILKELTNFGNTENNENEFKRSLNSAITMEDLENFLETTDRHLKRCTEKQLALQKDRDRLTEVNRINESEIINMKKFLTELSISFKTFSSIKDLYAQKLSRVVSVQRTVRREILNLDGRITDTMMCKLERGYAAIMQDLSECAMNLERWVERCIGRSISAEKIKQAFSSESDRTSLASTTFQNTSIEVQLEELENSFQKLLEEVLRAQKGEGAKDAQAVTVMEVRAEYEDKLNRMKAKMKQLYQEQIAIFKDKQKDEVAALERELVQAREKLAESSKAYEEHIRSLTTELWSVGEKFLMKKEEAEWLRRKQHSGSLMSLQHVHSSGLVPPPEEPSRPSDTYSLRSLPVNTNKEKRAEGREGRGMHMSDEEGEVFDNRWLKELSTPRRESVPPGQRLSELRWRNSLCPPHLKSSYPAETQFTAAVDEEDIKCIATANGGKQQRKEVGITAYKKPGPPTPSKQAGRLSATGSELRESLRVEAEPQASRKTSTPSRLRSLFRSTRNDTTEGTPRSRRLSNIFRKK